jgi:SNF2 family DNA or RNA helicase
MQVQLPSRTRDALGPEEKQADRADSASLQLDIPVSIFATGWNAALQRVPKIISDSVGLVPESPNVVSISIRRQKLKTVSITFPELPAAALPPGKEAGQPANALAKAGQASKSTTRIKPPTDIIKLEDRLYYLLQPPLETILHGGALTMPFEPFPYQYQGVGFLYPRYAAVLADEMGLGKTMQSITTVRLLLRNGEVKSVLLVCPKPLVTNWVREFSLWAPEIPICVISGDQAKRRWQWRELEAPVKIANYELLMRDRDEVIDTGLHFDLVMLDEAQRIKNRGSTTSQIARSIPRTRSWALTGTPVENSTEDLIGIFEFLAPGYLHSGMGMRDLANAAGDYILRRTKDSVMTDLPPKMFRDAQLELTPQQAESYQAAEEQGVVNLEGLGTELTIQHVFELVLRLKQICNFDPATGASSKLERLEADLEEVAASGQKAIVFSQWVESLKRIRQRVDHLGALEYHGKIPTKQRDEVIGRFKNDPSKHVILMSYGAGAVGLNLQFCRYVFLFDRWWNPAIEDQAINRAHRIGAAGSVTVTRMITVGTIEERINQVLEEKRELFATILSQADTPRNRGLTQSEIYGLFNLKGPPSRSAAA